MPITPPALPTIPPFPALADRATGAYNSKAYTWATEWDTTVAPAIEALADNAYDNAVEGAASAVAAAASASLAAQATGTAIGYTFDTTTTDSDPGAGKLRLNNATQNTATVIRADNASAAGSDVAALLATFGTGTSAVKGRLRIQHATDATKWLIFDVTAVASPSGYKNITASCTASSAANPFANADALAVTFTATGDKGDTGATGATGTFGGTANSTAELLTGSNIVSASTINLDTATGNRVHITGTTTITAVTLTRGPRTVIFDGVLTLTHHATNNNLPGGANITTAAGDRATYESDGTTVYCVSYIKANGLAVVVAGNHCVTMNTSNGNGSTNTCIQRYSTTAVNVGTAITLTQSATLGDSFTINQTGLYFILTTIAASGASNWFGASLNTTSPTNGVNGIPFSERLLCSQFASSDAETASGVFYLTAGDVVRAHTSGSTVSLANDTCVFTIRKVGS